MKKVVLIIGLSFIVVCGFLKNVYAAEAPANASVSKFRDDAEVSKKPSRLQSVECLSGIAFGKVREERRYRLVPLFLDFDFDGKPFFKRYHLNLPGLMQFTLEPFISDIEQPEQNIEFGNNFLIKVGFLPDTYKLQPYFVGGVGLNYMTLHAIEQATQFNFNEYAGGGLRCFLTKNFAVTAEYRYRHLSNASFAEPNVGINAKFVIIGISRSF